jgi:hypothetical protein
MLIMFEYSLLQENEKDNVVFLIIMNSFTNSTTYYLAEAWSQSYSK